MRYRIRKFSHVLERTGLAMIGAASGLLVAAHVGSSIASLTTQFFLLIMMIGGAVGFYLGIDIPPLAFDGSEQERSSRDPTGKVDSAEFLSAVGTFFAAIAAFASISFIVFRDDPHIFWTMMIMLGWTAGVVMQIAAGTIARFRA